MKIFNLVPHTLYPSEYNICSNTGACFYLKAKHREYSSSYFMEEFKNQYNKTYYEDEINLRNLAKKRLSILTKFIQPNNKKILEIGCAAGFFLSEAKKIGFIEKGIEISESESKYAKEYLNLNVDCISFLDFKSEEKYDIISAFFVIEHFSDQEKIFNKIFSLLNEGGFIFLALPSLNGPTYQTNPKEWFDTHPSDHFVDYSDTSLEKVLSIFNSKVIFRAPMSYHSQRDLGWRGKFSNKLIYKVLANISCYGDTIQMLAIKK